MINGTSGIHIAAFHPFVDNSTIRQNPPQHAADHTAHRYTIHIAGYISFTDLIADLSHGLEHTVCRRPQYPFPGVAADQTRYRCVLQGAPFLEHPAQVVSPHGFHRRMAVLTGGKARSYADNHRCHIHSGT